MRRLQFSDDLIYRVPQKTQVATVDIRIHPVTGNPYKVDAVLDTGAAVSRLSTRLLPDFGITNAAANYEYTMTVRVANNQTTQAYIHKVPIEFDGHMMEIEAAFCPAWGPAVVNLLGLKTFFDRMRMGFEHRGHSFYYTILS